MRLEPCAHEVEASVEIRSSLIRASLVSYVTPKHAACDAGVVMVSVREVHIDAGAAIAFVRWILQSALRVLSSGTISEDKVPDCGSCVRRTEMI